MKITSNLPDIYLKISKNANDFFPNFEKSATAAAKQFREGQKYGAPMAFTIKKAKDTGDLFIKGKELASRNPIKRLFSKSANYVLTQGEYEHGLTSSLINSFQRIKNSIALAKSLK